MADMGKEQPEPEIQVTDRRLFNREGERVERQPEPGPAPSGGEPPVAAAQESPQTGPDFGTFVMGLAQIAWLHLGEEDPSAGGPGKLDLPAAREMIDILGMLGEKTAGNLTPAEKHLLDTLLYQLRMDFTQKAAAR